MHKFSGLLKKHRVSIYAIVREMGQNPRTHCSLLTSKITGKIPVSVTDFVKMVDALNEIAHTDYVCEDIEYTPVKLMLT